MRTPTLYRRLCMAILVPALLAATSCHKLLDAPDPSDSIYAGAVFANDAAAQTAMIGIYNQMMDNPRGIFNGNISLYTALSADELGYQNPRAPEDSFYLNQLTASNQLSGTLFSSAYTLIYGLNSIVSGLVHSQGVTPGVKAELKGEAKFLRGLLYFYLVNLYGGVPLVTGMDYTVNARLPRATTDSVYAQVISDLSDAQQSLPVDYLTAPGYAGNRTRPVQAAASALLARVDLYLGQWMQAAQEATTVLSDPRYQLEPNLDNVFLSTSVEAIWQLQPVYDTFATADANIFLPAGPFHVVAYNLTPQLLGSMEAGDQRRVHWTDSVRMGNKVNVYAYKYKRAGYHADHAEYEMVLRLAEQLLIRAEARARLGDVPGAAADLDLVRARAGLAATTAVDQAGMLNAIQTERRVELFTEWGHRWLDLKRTGQATAVLQGKPAVILAIPAVMPAMPDWSATDVLYPIPGYELLGNPTITQNPGY